MEPTVRTVVGPDKVMVIWLDRPHKLVNTINAQMITELNQAVESLERDSDLAGAIFTSAKDGSFLMGADLFELRDLTDRQREEFLAAGQQLFDRIAGLQVPTAAAINGHCLGGGLELALACRYRLAADDGAITIGLPELKLGIVPAWGGTVRLPRLIGLPAALRLILTSKTLSPWKARRAGVIDEVVRPEALLAASTRKLLSRQTAHRPALAMRTAAAIRWTRERILEQARRATLEKTHGNYPAAEGLIAVMRRGLTEGPAAGLQAERESLLRLIRTPTCQNLLRLFFLRRESKSWITDRLSDKPAEVAYAAVIGGGTMGSGIIHALIRAGIRVRLVEVSLDAISAALRRIRKLLDEEIAEHRIDALEARRAFNRIAPTTEWTGLQLADMVIEAVAEDLPMKREVFAKLDGLTRPEVVLASNTSSLRIADLAQATSHPHRVIGLHFFNPVNKMPLVEIAAAPSSRGQALATAARLMDRIGKLAILVEDAPGFVVNRIMLPYLTEPLVMVTEGADIRSIDRVMTRWGIPMGPFELLDQVGLDVALHVLSSLADPFTDRVRDVAAMSAIERVVEHGWLGRKSGRGFYVYDRPGRKRGPAPVHEQTVREINPRASAQAVQPAAESRAVNEQEIQDRLVLPMVNEAARLLREGVIDRPEALDLATVFGLGFAPFRGGVVRFADSVGAAELVRRLEDLSARHGARFSPDELLRRLSETGRPLSGWQPAARPAMTRGAPPDMARAAQAAGDDNGRI